jgi:hypothetical protein
MASAIAFTLCMYSLAVMSPFLSAWIWRRRWRTPARFWAENMAWIDVHTAAAVEQPRSWLAISSDMEERSTPLTLWSCVHHVAYAGLGTDWAASPVPSATVSAGAAAVPSRKP